MIGVFAQGCALQSHGYFMLFIFRTGAGSIAGPGSSEKYDKNKTRHLTTRSERGTLGKNFVISVGAIDPYYSRHEHSARREPTLLAM